MTIKLPFPVEHNVSLASLSTFAIGGLAKNHIPVSGAEDLIKVLNYFWRKKLKFKIFAGGSNIVFPDQGLNDYLIQFKDGKLVYSRDKITADAGIMLSLVIEKAISHGLTGLENLSGIPGSIGGAIVGNAGAYGLSVSEVVNRVLVWYQGKVKWLTKKECKFGYRESVFKKKPFIVIKAEFVFEKSDAEKLRKISDEIINLRKVKYKEGLKSPGSFFKNVLSAKVSPEVLSKIKESVIIAGKIPAGFLLTEVGARGMKVGGIEVSDFHGNLLINNKGNGTSHDVNKLAAVLKEKVRKKFGILLEEEVRYF